jgi:hypothetical protein
MHEIEDEEMEMIKQAIEMSKKEEEARAKMVQQQEQIQIEEVKQKTLEEVK